MRARILTTAIAALLLGVACGGDDAGEAAAAAAPELDLTSLESEAAAGTYQAELIEATYVGEVDADMFLGVQYRPDAAGPGEEVRAYLCNGEQVSHWLAGTIEADGSATLLPEQLVLEGTPAPRVELDTGDELTGRVFIDDDAGRPVSLAAASGDAGIYRAEETFDGNTSVASWIVLPDGRQVGGECEILRCGRNPVTGSKVCFCVKRK